MKAAFYEAYGSPDVVEVREVDKPAIEDHQVLVRVHASSVNPAEWYTVKGPWFVRLFGTGLRRPKDHRVGADLAGRIEAVGSDVTEFQPGDEVFGTGGAAWAEYAAAREVRLVPKPPNVSFEEAAAVPIAALTALQALRDHGQLEPGQKVLINGASGGVGTYAVQIAKALGADVTAVCSTRNVEQARALGADRVIDYSQEDFTELDIRHDLLIDIAGSKPFSKLRRVLTPEARVVIVGAKFPGRGLGPSGSHGQDAPLGPGQEPEGEVLHREDHEGRPRGHAGTARQRPGQVGRRPHVSAERRSRGAGLPGRRARARKSRPHHVADP